MMTSTEIVGSPSKEAVRDTSKDGLSAAAVNACIKNVVSGIIRSLSIYLYREECDDKKVLAKVRTVVNAFLSNKDINEGDADWLITTLLMDVRSHNHNCACVDDPVNCYSDAYLDWYNLLSNCVNDRHISSWCFENEDGLSDHEKGILANLAAARTAFYKAEAEFNEYFGSATRESVKRFMLKYGTTLSQVAHDWYSSASRLVGLKVTEVNKVIHVTDETED